MDANSRPHHPPTLKYANRDEVIVAQPDASFLWKLAHEKGTKVNYLPLSGSPHILIEIS